MERARGRVALGRRGVIGIAPAILGLLLVSAMASQVQAQSATEWVEAVFPERSHNFGTVAKGSVLRHNFKITNRTNREVRISGWKPMCGCTDVNLGAQAIPPGAQTTLEVVFDTTKFSGYKATGLTLYLEQPSARTIDYSLTSFIQDEIEVTPGVLDFGDLKRGGTAEKIVTLRYRGGQKNWRVIDMRHANSSLSAELQEVPRPGNDGVEYRLVARLDPNRLRNGNFRDQITLITNDEQRKTIPLSVVARVSPEVSLSPAVLNLGSVRAGQRVERTVLLRGSTPFRVMETKAVEGAIAVSGASPDTSRPLHQIKVAIETPPASNGAYHAILEIETDHPDEPPVRLTAFATVVP
ncbi:DUF1573 domain-containing protein [Tautonia rosea]|uniref:DUF1573 domain-containing protein n=1 Tax=Tautonia rosea TaxID=2728037 RepID=UPI001472E6CE|nr:DUF1573 domain-containing protein [Tautonia rosea]